MLRADGAASERERINGVRAQLIPGHEALIEKLAFDGQTTPGAAAMAVNQAERDKLAAQQAARSVDAPAPIKTKPVDPNASAGLQHDDGTPKGGRAGLLSDPVALDQQATAYMKANAGCSYEDALRALGA